MNTNYNYGLNDELVVLSRKKFGKNVLTNKKKKTFIKLIIESLGDPIIKILIIALFIKIIFLFQESNIFETIGIAIAVFLAAFISALSEYGSEKAFEKLNNENQYISCKVLRNSKKIIINSEELVVGDILYLETGDKVPCDCKIIEGTTTVNESALTGESKEKNKVINDNLFMGSIINNGNCKTLVVNIGDNTYYGNIASLVQEYPLESPLKTRLRHLAKYISTIGYICAFIVFLSYMFNAFFISKGIIDIFNYKELFSHIIYGLTLSVAVIVMAVPEGLPMMITLVLSSNMKRMIKNNVLVRKLVGIETAGSMDILFTDKTGTLTEGKLKVVSLVDSVGNTYNDFKAICNNEILYQSLIYNNDSFINNNIPEGGNITDQAILSFTKTDDRTKYKILKNMYFTSEKKYSMVMTNHNNTTFIKGSFEILIDNASYYLENNKKRVLIDKEKYIKEIKEYNKLGYRTLGISINNKYSIENNTFIGYILIKDNIRSSAYKAVENLRDAGIQIVMVTGDSKETAINVANNLKILNNNKDVVLSSGEFNLLSDIEIKKILKNLKVLYRCLPQDKNRLVKISQENDYIVGMTGDGVNDAPALKRADVGFSMGSGTEIAKETSDIVILDDNISSICTAVLYGRTIFKSIRKFIVFQLTANLCAVLLSIFSPIIGIITPITVIQMLWINMVIDTFAGIAFAFEPPLIEYMKEKPKKRNESILNKYMINQIICNGMFSFAICIWFLKSKFIGNIFMTEITDRYLYSAFFGLFIFISVFNAFNSRTYRINVFSNILKNKVFLLVLLFISFIQIILIYYGGELFRTTGITIIEFEIMILTSSLIIPFDILRKIIMKKKNIIRNI